MMLIHDFHSAYNNFFELFQVEGRSQHGKADVQLFMAGSLIARDNLLTIKALRSHYKKIFPDIAKTSRLVTN